ncbi:hypothetical protein [Hymenobacter sp. YC55]|uniref:hypothetical protein n=1 Tax=Hymenobacter sp. YC55 TaxID=3034019 RepID=UPI0023F75401|nr:hypothetical protein [Hymenobacter sp. YC55]MDF7809947.1 hypothetical protein [Hymenobacter sp. YC55]
MEAKGIIIINSTLKNGEWTATATIDGQFAGSATASGTSARAKKYAEAEARRAGESFRRELQQSSTWVGSGSYHVASIAELPETVRRSHRRPQQQFDQVSAISLLPARFEAAA